MLMLLFRAILLYNIKQNISIGNNYEICDFDFRLFKEILSKIDGINIKLI